MKKAFIYTLSLAVLLSLSACHNPQADKPSEPQEPEIQQTEPVSTEPTTPAVETDPQEEPIQTEPTEPVEVAEPPVDTTQEQLVDTAPETPAEKPQEVILPKPSKTETESAQSQEPVSPPPAQQEPTEQQPAEQQSQQPSEPQSGGDSATDIEARKQAFLNGMNQMFEDHGYSTDGVDHIMTEEEFRALQNAMGMSGG